MRGFLRITAAVVAMAKRLTPLVTGVRYAGSKR